MEVKRIGNLYGEDKGTGFAGNVWDKFQLCPTIMTMQGGGREPMIIEETKCVGGLSDSVWGGKQYHQQDRVYKGDIALAEPANLPGGSYKYIVAMRGRGEDNEQQLELNTQGVVNALTTVQKDNLVMEEKGAKQNDEEKRIREIWKPASDKQGARSYRIRKLTPREVWRLMGYTDEDFDKAAAVNSQTQLYKQAGNAIVKQVLMAIFRQLKLKTKGENNVR